MTEQEFQDVVSFLEETPRHIRQFAAEMSEQDLRWKPSNDEFSVVEQVCHLCDLEREGYSARIRKMLTENQPKLPDFDGSRIARERDYNQQDFESAFQEFASEREENVRVMKTLSPDQLNRSGVLEGVGTITLERLFQLMREHDQSHRKELKELQERISVK
jgi:DinB superfamily